MKQKKSKGVHLSSENQRCLKYFYYRISYSIKKAKEKPILRD